MPRHHTRRERECPSTISFSLMHLTPLHLEPRQQLTSRSPLVSNMKALKLLSALGLLAATATAETHRYESDISKLRNIVIHSIYSHKDVFLRELLSNSADALQKLRITNLREGHGLEGWQGNITIEARKNEGGKGGQLVIRGESALGLAGWLGFSFAEL